MTRPAYRRRGRWLQFGLTGIVMGGWWAAWQVALAHHWRPVRDAVLFIVGVVAVGALLAVLIWLDRRSR